MNDVNDTLISDRIHRQWWWLAGALTVHVAALTAALVLSVAGPLQPVGVTVAAIVIAVGSPITGVWLERRDPVFHRPAMWMRRACGPVVLQAIAVGLASEAVIPAWPAQVIVAAGLGAAQLGCVAMASRAMRFPLSPELGEMDVEVTAKIRNVQRELPAWALLDEVRLTGDEIVAVLQPGPMSLFGLRISLADVSAVWARQARAKDSPWLRLPDGRAYCASAGGVVEIRHRAGVTVIPVHQPVAFAEVVRARIATRCAKAEAGQRDQ